LKENKNNNKLNKVYAHIQITTISEKLKIAGLSQIYSTIGKIYFFKSND